jgi:hypothetical protein
VINGASARPIGEIDPSGLLAFPRGFLRLFWREGDGGLSDAVDQAAVFRGLRPIHPADWVDIYQFAAEAPRTDRPPDQSIMGECHGGIRKKGTCC